MNYNEIIIDSVYNFEKDNALKESYKNKEISKIKKIGRFDKYINKLKYRFSHLKSLKRIGKYYIPDKTKYKVDKQLIKDAQIIVDSQLHKISRSCLLTAEIMKISAKMKLRYSYKSLEFTSAILKEIYKDKSFPFEVKNYKWIKALAPIIHLPNDDLEIGSLHIDRNIEEGKTITIWIPFTKYKYPGIVTKRKIVRILAQYLGDRVGNFIFKRFEDCPLRESNNPAEWMSWNDTFIHQGMLNKTNEIAIAFMVRLSNKLIENPCINVEKLLDIGKKNDDKFLIEQNKNLINDAQNIAMEFIKQIKNNDKKTSKEFLGKIQKSKIIYNFLKNLNSKKEQIFVLHISHLFISLVFDKVKYLNKNKLDNKSTLSEELFEISTEHLKLKLSRFFN